MCLDWFIYFYTPLFSQANFKWITVKRLRRNRDVKARACACTHAHTHTQTHTMALCGRFKLLKGRRMWDVKKPKMKAEVLVPKAWSVERSASKCKHGEFQDHPYQVRTNVSLNSTRNQPTPWFLFKWLWTSMDNVFINHDFLKMWDVLTINF